VTPPAVVIAAGLGTRLRPLTDRYAKPVLPIGGVPVLASLLHELAAAGCPGATVVIGHRGEQVERLAGDGSGFGLNVRYARQEAADGSLDAVLAAAPEAPYLVLGADVLFAPGDVGRFAASFESSGADGAIAIRPRPGTVRVRDGRVERILSEEMGVSAAPLWAVGPGVGRFVDARPGRRPYELATAFQLAIDGGEEVSAIEIGETLDLTTPLDLLAHNFPYLGGL
jgi:GTP:adenosylcobinamide-phosphate guanylyltransferase